MLVYGWMLFGLVMLAVTHEARCPRCGQRFYAKGAEFSQMTKRCLHCGQEKYADLSARLKPEAGQS
jgi:tRNA(Ile2) C34 agmatinyltransferase TiaS